MEKMENVDVATTEEGAKAQTTFVQPAKRRNQFKRNQAMFVWGWLALPIIAWAVFYWYVNFSSFVSAFQDLNTNEFTMQNFKDVWAEIMGDEGGLGSLSVGFKNTLLYFLLDIFVKYPIQLIVCYFLYKQIVGYKIFRFVYYLPAILPAVALTTVFKQFVSPWGVLSKLGFSIPDGGLLGNVDTASQTVMMYTVWLCVSGHMLLLCGAMNRIPVDVLEAARLDGIGPAREFVSLIIPLIWPTLSTLLVLTCCGFLGATGPILLLCPSTYEFGTTTINYWIFEKVYQGGSVGAGKYNLVSAAGLLLTVIAVPCVLLIRKLLDMIPSVDY